MKCRCILESGEVILYSTSYSYSSDRIVFSETDEKQEKVTYYLLEKTGENKTRLTIDFYLRKNILTETMFKLKGKKELEQIYNKSLANLSAVVQEVKMIEQSAAK